uniref:GST N-terminal domain-containing protein n=1 Tax=Acrobeloides nanus TaxID=290746 RepID=A0A914DXU5_9BILA
MVHYKISYFDARSLGEPARLILKYANVPFEDDRIPKDQWPTRKLVYLEWIVKAWDSIPKEAISKSFNTCEVTNAVGGSKDNEIHCFKPDGPVPTDRDLLKQARAEKKIIELIEEIDLSEDENNNVYDSEASVDD